MPEHFGTYGSDTLTIAAKDTGSGSAPITTKNVAITVPEVTLAPVDTIPGTQTVNENSTLTFSSGNSNAIAFSTTDGNVEQVTLSVANGTLTLGSTTGLTSVTGNGTNSVVIIQGSTANINTALNGLAYAGTFGTYGSDTLTIAAKDTGSGAPITTKTVAITVPEVTLAPVDTISGTQTVNENSTLTFSSGNSNAITFSTTDGNVEQVTCQSLMVH